jgi:putative transposase
LIEGINADVLIADKGYDAGYILEACKKSNTQVVIPPKSNRKEQRDYDTYLYKERNLVERMFNKLKHYRRIASRYDKTAVSFLSFIQIGAVAVILK